MGAFRCTAKVAFGMDCPSCQTDNSSGAKFCMTYGTALPFPACPGCGTELPAGARFCYNCGQQLAEAQTEAVQPRLKQYIPKELLAKLEAAQTNSGIEADMDDLKLFGLGILRWVVATMGAPELGRQRYLQAREITADFVPIPRVWHFAMLALFEITVGDLVAVKANVWKSLAGFNLGNFVLPSPGFVLLARRQLTLAKREYNRALTELDEMVSILKKAGVRALLPDALYLKGQALLALGRTDKAYQALIEARTEAEATGSRRSLWPVLAALSQDHAQRGNAAEAAVLRRRAQEVVEYIGEHAGSTSGLRTSLLSLPDVRALLREE